jgi:hypothetical protein
MCLRHYRALYEISLSKELQQLYLTFLQTIVHETDVQNHAKKRNKLKKSRNYIDIDYLRDNTLVIFMRVSGTDASVIDYIKGSHILEYKDTDLIGTDITNLIPVKYRTMHRTGNGKMFRSMWRPFDQSNF